MNFFSFVNSSTPEDLPVDLLDTSNVLVFNSISFNDYPSVSNSVVFWVTDSLNLKGCLVKDSLLKEFAHMSLEDQVGGPVAKFTFIGI